MESQSAEEAAADDVVKRAREAADAVLEVAREKADDNLTSAPAKAEIDALERQRTVADNLLETERSVEDERLNAEREQIRLLEKLIPLEREATDRHLLTERRRSDAALAKRDDFLNIVSHDLRNLLSGIVMSSQLLAHQTKDTDQAAPAALQTERIERYAARMNRLIGDLLDIGSIDAGRLAIVPARGDLALAVRESLDTFQAAAHAKGIVLEAANVERPLLADFDHERMLQVFANLITNAIKFTETGGQISVHCKGDPSAIHVAIQDSGAGIPEALLEVVFERFWQVGKSDRRGLGLGLYISRSIVEAHGGKIWVESKVGEGSRFCVELPLHQATASAKEQESTPRS